jgi:hypothetical protein
LTFEDILELKQVVVIGYVERYKTFYWTGNGFIENIYLAKHYKGRPSKQYIQEELEDLKKIYPDKDLYCDVVTVEI